MMLEMEEVKDAALKYDKPTLARMAQMGQISPTTAVMAGMMRDRIVQSEMKPPEPPTVAEEILAPPQAGLGAIAPQGMGGQMPMGQMPMGQPQMAQAPQQGLDQIPVPDQMFEPQGMAGGGIVAFSNGGTSSFASAPSFANLYSGLNPEMEEIRRLLGVYPGETTDQKTARRKEEQALRLMEAGLGIMGGTSPYFAANLAGAAPAIKGYGEDLRAQRKEDLARQMAERAETGKIFETVVAGRRSAAERASVAEEAEKGRTFTGRESELNRRSQEKIANLPPEIIRGARAIQKPGEPLEAAVARYANITSNKDQYNAAAGLVKSAFDAASKRFENSLGGSGGNFSLSQAAGGNKDAQKRLGITKEQAEAELKRIKGEYLKEAYKDIGMTPDVANQYLRAPRGGAANSSDAPEPSAPPQAAIDDLKNNNTPLRRKQFDEIFGPGAADRVLPLAKAQ